MLSLFPQILFLAPFSALLIRIALFSLFAYAAMRHFGKPGALARLWGAIEIATAILLLAGAWVQAVAILAFVSIFVGLFVPSLRVYPRSTMLLALVMCVSLLVTGAGAIAFDLPL